MLLQEWSVCCLQFQNLPTTSAPVLGAKSCSSEPGVHSKKYAKIMVFFRPMRFMRGTATKEPLAAASTSEMSGLFDVGGNAGAE
jgi:hypothetical protein